MLKQATVAAIRAELTDHIIPFWLGLIDETNGGFIGQVDFDLTRRPEADKGCILNSRILWFFSEAYITLREPRLLEAARHAYAMLERMLDPVHGGVYWAMHADGSVADATKHTYNQGFAVYALSAYYRACGDKRALERAREIYRLIESRCRDAGGYLEAFTADWQPESNEKLSENGVMATRTMNTLLHVLEGYTGLYQAEPTPEVADSLREILDIWDRHVWNPEKRRQEVFFDGEYHSLIDLYSCGHDIETAWLADRTLEVLGDEVMTASIRPKLLAMAEQCWQSGRANGGFLVEIEKGVPSSHMVWWVQAEALVGFLNAAEKTGDGRYLEQAEAQWDYIRRAIIDPREGGEWYWYVLPDGTPARDPIVEPWKCPYHNGRMALEVLRRCGHK